MRLGGGYVVSPLSIQNAIRDKSIIEGPGRLVSPIVQITLPIAGVSRQPDLRCYVVASLWIGKLPRNGSEVGFMLAAFCKELSSREEPDEFRPPAS